MNHFFPDSNTLLKSPLSVDEDGNEARKSKAVLWELWITIVICSLQFLFSITPFWYCLEKVTYHYQIGDPWSPLQTLVIESSYYGLFSAHLNRWTINHSWFSLKNGVCEQVSSASLGDAICGTRCLQHLQTRCDVYTKVCFLGVATFGLLSIGCGLLLFALRRFKTGVKTKFFFESIWVLGYCCINIAMLIQIFLVKNNLRKLTKTSLFPPVRFSFAFYLSCAVVLFLSILKIGLFFCQHNFKLGRRDGVFKNQVQEPYRDASKGKKNADVSTGRKSTFTTPTVTHYQPPITKSVCRPPMQFIY